jgi:hypothetical protein
MTPKNHLHVRADAEFDSALTALIEALTKQDGVKPTKSTAVRRAVIHMERTMRTAKKEQTHE